MPDIHATAVIEDGAILADDVRIGAYCCVGADVELGAGVELKSHVVIAGRTRIGAGTRIFPFASIGHEPQDLKYKGEPSALEIGSGTTIREHVTINPGTEGGGMITRVGNRCLLMMGAHVAHDCLVGDGVIMANNATLGGHVVVGEQAILGGLSAVRQFVRIGAHAMVGGMSGVEQDVIPFGTVYGERASLRGLNIVGMKRRGFDRNQIHGLRRAYTQLFSGTDAMTARLDGLRREFAGIEVIEGLIAFVADAQGGLGICRPSDIPTGTDGEDAT